MNMFKILLPVDGNVERAKLAANAVTGLPGTSEDIEATILNVFKEASVRDEGAGVNTKDLFDPDDFPESAEVAQGILEEAGITTSMRRELGDPSREIIGVADEIDADCIAISGRKRSPTKKALFGSVTQDILLSSGCHVYVTIDSD
jgi:nucleotide-binding universal stress UspA family protein